MAFVNMPIFVILVMSSPVWLTIAGIITRNYPALSRSFFAYALLMLAINISIYLSFDVAAAWTVAFASPALVWIPASALSLWFTFWFTDSDISLFNFLLIFGLSTFFSFLVLLFLIYFAQGLVSIYHQVVVTPLAP